MEASWSVLGESKIIPGELPGPPWPPRSWYQADSFRFFLDLGSHHVGHIFSSKRGEGSSANPLLEVYVLFRFLGRPGPVLAPFGLDLGRSGARFWMVFGLDFRRCWALFWKFLMTGMTEWSFAPFCWRLVLDGLVGLREAQRIEIMCQL